MATQNAMTGFRPTLITATGAPGRWRKYGKPSSDSNPIYQYDLVMKVASSVPSDEGGNPVPSIKGANLGTAGTGLWLGSSLGAGAASKATMHFVSDEAGMIYTAQSDSASAETIAALVGKNTNFNVSGGSNAQLGPIPAGSLMSGMTVKSSTIATTAGLDGRILGFLDTSGNPDNAVYPVLEVQIVLHQYAGQSAGV